LLLLLHFSSIFFSGAKIGRLLETMNDFNQMIVIGGRCPELTSIVTDGSCFLAITILLVIFRIIPLVKSSPM